MDPWKVITNRLALTYPEETSSRDFSGTGTRLPKLSRRLHNLVYDSRVNYWHLSPLQLKGTTINIGIPLTIPKAVWECKQHPSLSTTVALMN